MLLGSIDPYYTIVGFLVGALIGATGVGGGSLLTPVLIVLFGVSPATAVGTDLLFAAATKTVGSIVHGFNQTIEWRIIGLLATGSIPATALALAVLSWLELRSGGASHLITAVLSIVLLLTAGALISRNKISTLYAHRLTGLDDRSIAGLTIVMGALLGILVTFSSVGAGAIGVTASIGACRPDCGFRYCTRGAPDADGGTRLRSDGGCRSLHSRIPARGLIPRHLHWQLDFGTRSRCCSPLSSGCSADRRRR